jgi:fructose/tagatose bisphosphate aldolase
MTVFLSNWEPLAVALVPRPTVFHGSSGVSIQSIATIISGTRLVFNENL